MEKWESLLKGLPKPPEYRYVDKVVQCAAVVLKEDLAPFEFERVIETLLFKPVNLLSTITSQRSDDAWCKVIGDAFKLLADVVTRHGEHMEHFFENIVTVCLLSYDAQTRKLALQCLTAVARWSPCGARDVARHITSLQDATCRAPLALLVGTICEFHPEVVADEATTIWRTYLNLLECHKNTDTIKAAVLQGIAGLFQHFGCELPTAELNNFYSVLSDLLHESRCETVCLQVLERHAALFRERVAADSRARAALWRAAQDGRGAGALRSAYRALSSVLDRRRLQEVVDTEILPRTQSHRTQVKYTALRILTDMKSAHDVSAAGASEIDVQALEFQLRESVSYDDAEAISWCIECNLPNSDKLLLSAILFYPNLPAAKRKETVVYGILNAPPDLRTTAVTFLATESCQQEDSLEKHLPLWRDLFDASKGQGQDTVVVERSRLVFEDFMSYVGFVLEAFLEEPGDSKKLPEKLAGLLTLTRHVVSLQPAEEYAEPHCAALLPALAACWRAGGAHAAALGAARAACARLQGEGRGQAARMVDIDRCRDEALLCESCLTLVEAPTGAVDKESVIVALKIIFSRSDVEAAMLSNALQKLESIILEEDGLDPKSMSEILHLIEKLRTRKDITGKDARVLHRDVLMFLGKYGNKSDAYSPTADDTLIAKLKDTLVLTVPNPNEGTSYKINLQSLLQLAITHEDPRALQTLLVIICLNLSVRREPTLQHGLARVAHALSRAHARGAAVGTAAVQSAVLMCDSAACVRGILACICEERSPGVRKMLSDALEALLLHEPGSEVTETLVTTVAESAAEMLSSGDSTSRRAGLNATETLTIALNGNNTLAKRLLPNILELVTKTNELDSEITFELASKVFMDKVELFDKEDLGRLHGKLVGALLAHPFPKSNDKRKCKNKMANEIDARIYRNTVKMALEFTTKVQGYKKEDLFSKIFQQESCGSFYSGLYILAELRRCSPYDTEEGGDVLGEGNLLIINKLLNSDVSIESDQHQIEAILRFLEEFADFLLERFYEPITGFIGKIIANLTPKCVKYLQRNIKSCLSAYSKIWKKTPSNITASFEDWCRKLPIAEISNAVDKDFFSTEHALIVNALKIMLNVSNLTDPSTILTEIADYAQKWPKILLKLYSNEYITKYLRSNMAYLSDLLTVGVRFSKVTDVKRLILEGHNVHGVSNEKIGLEFCRFFIHVFSDCLLQKPYLLLDGDMKSCCIVLNYLVKHVLKKKWTGGRYENVLELVDQFWPTYSANTTFDQKHSLLLDLTNSPERLNRESNPMRWAVAVIFSEQASREDKARILGVLPGGEQYSDAYKAFGCSLPTRLRELRGGAHASLRALLDALAATSDPQLLALLMTLASADETAGWWDDAIDSCMASVALRSDPSACDAAYARCWEGLSLGVCRRVLLPLLRYSPASCCEQFFSRVAGDLLGKLAKRPASAPDHYTHRKCVADYCRAATVLQIVFEKIPPSSLESPNSPLYSELRTQQAWHLVREACRLCYNLLEKLSCPPEADEPLSESYRLFKGATYNCLCAAICRRRPAASFYEHVFNARAWAALVDRAAVYKLPLRGQWNQPTKRQSVSIELEGGEGASSARTATLRTRLFLRTLSENPLQYDLFVEEDGDAIQTQELQLDENELNRHVCAATLTATVRHASALAHKQWTRQLAGALVSDMHTNVKLLLAQVICNCKEELMQHASAFRAALLAMVAGTTSVENGKRLLNGLHVDILKTIILWRDDTPQGSPELTAVVECLLTTCLVNRQRQSIYRALLDTLTKLLDLYGTVVQVSWSVFEPHLSDNVEPSKTVQLLQLVSKSKIHIPELLPTLLARLESKQWHQLSKLSELLGLAMAACRTHRSEMLRRFQKVLDRTRMVNRSDYVTMLYYAQAGYTGCCDELNFRMITDRTTEVMGPEKSKCLRIISTYLAGRPPSEYISDMFETIEISELVAGGNCVEALGVVREGLLLMGDGLRRRSVMQAAGCCRHSALKTRRAACEVMLRAYEALFTKTSPESSAKRPKTSTTPILSAMETNEVYTTTVLACIREAATDPDEGLASMVREGVQKWLCKDDMAVRFAECFLLTMHLPSTSGTVELAACVSSLLLMLFSDLRSLETFRRIRLRDEPLETRESTAGPSKLLTMSKTYQGTFRGLKLTGKRTNIHNPSDTSSLRIDVQIPIESILDTLLQFCKDVPEAAQALCVQIVKSLLGQESRGFDFRAAMLHQLAAILKNDPNDITPLAIELCRVVIEDAVNVDCLKTPVAKLRSATVGTEGEFITKLLHEEIKLRCEGGGQFVLGRDGDTGDVAMTDNSQFDIRNLTAAFGKLSKWDDLTLQQKKRVWESGLPTLWTDQDSFKARLDSYSDSGGWFGRMVSAYRHEDKQDSIKWLREMDRWPRRHFAMSAVTEAIEWHNKQTDLHQFPSDIKRQDCLAEWAARLMIRTAYVTSLEHDSDSPPDYSKLSRSHERKWCERANEMALPSLVLDCVRRNTQGEQYECETLEWLQQSVLALHTMGLQKRDSGALHKALRTIERYSQLPELVENSSGDVIVGLHRVTLMLHRDLETLSQAKLQNIIEEVDKQKLRTHTNKQTFSYIYEFAMTYYDDLCSKSTEASEQNELVSKMTDVLGRAIDMDLPRSVTFVDVILNRLDSCNEELPLDVARGLLDKIQRLLQTLDDFALDALKSHVHLFPSHLLSDYGFMKEGDDDSTVKYRKCLQLLCDAEYSLLSYCGLLQRALAKSDEKEWKEVLDRTNERMFNNPHAGLDYQVLAKYKDSLLGCTQWNCETFEVYKDEAEETVKEIIRALRQRKPQNVLRLSQLCPALDMSRGERDARAAERDACLAKLLGLPAGLTVVKFDEQIPVFVDSIRRPGVLRARLSDGSARRYLHKSGEPLRGDAAAMRVVRAAGARAGAYNVTPLSEDCGLIEFLEDHERVRTLISNYCDVDAVLSNVTRRADDDELILAPTQASLHQHEQLCARAPAHALRSQAQRHCASAQRFVAAQRRFVDTLSAVTVFTWLLGLGDRHLQNILYSVQDGSVCGVDWAALFQYGSAELPPARLTRNILAMCDTQVLESRIQSLWSSLRDEHQLLLSVIRVSFKWMGAEFDDKYQYIESLLSGAARSCDVTRAVIAQSEKRYKHKYMQLLDDVFDSRKDTYSVEEQVSCLLLQCTEPRILSVTRSGWEPWL